MIYNRSLDGLRGVAILSVMLFHFGYFGAGWIGVQLFFVLSGYLITSILRADRELPVGLYFKRFYWRRSLRIFPLYFGYLALLAAVFLVSGLPPEFRDRWPYLVTYTYNYALLIVPFHQSVSFTHLWSLAIEEQFYLLWPVVVYYLSAAAIQTTIGAVLLVAPLLRLLAVMAAQDFVPGHPEPGLFAYSPLPCQCDALAMGAGVALLKKDFLRRPSLTLKLVTAIALGVGFVNLTLARPGWWHSFGAAWDAVNDLGYPPFSTARFQHVWSYTIINVWAAVVIVNLRQAGRLAVALSHRFLVYSGKISYGLYVLHYPVLGVVKWIVFYHVLSVKGILVFAVYMPAVYLLAHLSFTYFESWFLKWKDTRYRHAQPGLRSA